MIEAPSEADVTFSRTSGSHATALSARPWHPRRWRLALELRTQADLTTTITTAAPSSSSAQSNKLGQYHCWNRQYDIHTGRWTTTDPVMNPWTNSLMYVTNRPTQKRDLTGLEEWVGGVTPHTITDYYKLSITTTKFEPNTCGGFVWETKWGLKPGAKRTGQVVQRIKFEFHIINCDDESVDERADEYVEGWTIGRQGTQSQQVVRGSAHDDSWFENAHPNTAGWIKVTAEANFYETGNANALHDLGWKGDTSKRWGALEGSDDNKYFDSDKLTNLLPKGTTQSFSSVTRGLKVSWNCCPNKDKGQATNRSGPTTVDYAYVRTPGGGEHTDDSGRWKTIEPPKPWE